MFIEQLKKTSKRILRQTSLFTPLSAVYNLIIYVLLDANEYFNKQFATSQIIIYFLS